PMRRLLSLILAATAAVTLSLPQTGASVGVPEEFVPPHNWELPADPVPTPVRSIQIYSIRPEPVWADERREPTPPPRVKSWSRHNPDWRCDEWMPLAREVGWAEEQLPKLSYVIYRETRCRPDQHNPDDPMGGSNGLTQINQFWCKPTQYWPGGWLQTHGILDHCDELYDPRISLTASLALWENSGWSPWFP
ncbi:MAG: hypothetical protein ACO395_08360, partial [Pontimonas sp.]